VGSFLLINGLGAVLVALCGPVTTQRRSLLRWRIADGLGRGPAYAVGLNEDGQPVLPLLSNSEAVGLLWQRVEWSKVLWAVLPTYRGPFSFAAHLDGPNSSPLRARLPAPARAAHTAEQALRHASVDFHIPVYARRDATRTRSMARASATSSSSRRSGSRDSWILLSKRAMSINLFGDAWDDSRDRPGWQWKRLRVGRRLAAEKLGGTLYELAPNQKTFPYHWHVFEEEWLIVLAGRPTLRDASGERTLESGDCVVFKRGPRGAHAVRNETDEPARLLLLSSGQDLEANIAFYPDSGKVGLFGHELRKIFREDTEVDYFEGEE
jgi:uncharacterized cupin superfamily protein